MILANADASLPSPEILIVILSGLFALVSVFISVWLYVNLKKKESYVIFDKSYASLLEKGLENPSLRDPLKTCHYDDYIESDRAFYLKYCAYAYMVWNFLETIYDLSNSKSSKKRKLFNTWTLVMMEENKLHYRWFIKNHALFKKQFQDYVRNTVNSVTLEEKTDVDTFNVVFKRIKQEFPAEELKDKSQVMSLLIKNQYHLYTARFTNQDVSDKTIIGYAIYYTNKENNFIFLDYLNILPEYQNCGHGSKIFNFVLEKIKGDNPQGVIFEIESSKNGGHSIKNRRRQFYSKLGASELYCPYRTPCKNNKSIPMDLMFRPVDGVAFVHKEGIRSFLKEAISTIHAEYPNTNELITTYIDLVPNYEANSDIELYKGTMNDFEQIIGFLNNNYPMDLLTDKERIKVLMSKENYELILLKDQEGILLGYAFAYLPADRNFLFLDYLSIFPFYRNHGYGKMFIQKLCVKSYRLVKYGIVCESFITTDKKHNYEGFITRTDGHFLDAEYNFPYKQGKIPMKLVFYPKDGVDFVKGNEFDKFMHEVLLAVHDDDVNETNYQEFIDEIGDFER